MGALTETTSNITEFAGKFKVAAVEVDPSTSTSGTVTIDEMDTVVAAFAQVKSTTAAINTNVVLDNPIVVVNVDGTTTNQINCQLLEGDGSVNTQNQLDFYLLAIGY